MQQICFVNKEAAKEYKCQICREIMKQPVQIACKSGHLFCKFCITEVRKSTPTPILHCPICSTSFDPNSTTGTIQFIERKINDLIVLCPNHNPTLSKSNSNHININNKENTNNNKNNTQPIKLNLPVSTDNNTNTNILRQLPVRFSASSFPPMPTAIISPLIPTGTILSANNNSYIARAPPPIIPKKDKKKRKRFDDDSDIIILNDEPNTKKQKVHTKQINIHCEWVGRYGDLNKHIIICPFRIEKCQFCKREMKCKDMDIHIYQCKYKPIFCPQCNAIAVPRCQLNYHKSTSCPMTIIKCGLCSHAMTRKDLVNHKKYRCAETFIPCEYTIYGCTMSIKRKHQKKHNNEYMERHLQCIKQSHTKLWKMHMKLNQNCLHLQHRLDEIERRANQNISVNNNKVVRKRRHRHTGGL